MSLSRGDMNDFLSDVLMNAKDIPVENWGGGTVAVSYSAKDEVLSVFHSPDNRDFESQFLHYKLVPVRQTWEEVREE